MKCRALSKNKNIIWFGKNGEEPDKLWIKLNVTGSENYNGNYYNLSDATFIPGTPNILQINEGASTIQFYYQFDENSTINGTLLSLLPGREESISHQFPSVNETYSLQIISGSKFSFDLPPIEGEHHYNIPLIKFASNVQIANLGLNKSTLIEELVIPKTATTFNNEFASNEGCEVTDIYYTGTETEWDNFVSQNNLTPKTFGADYSEDWEGDNLPSITYDDSTHTIDSFTTININILPDEFNLNYTFRFYIYNESSINFGDDSPVRVFPIMSGGIFTLTTLPVQNYSENVEAVRDSLIQRLSVLKGELWYQINFGLPLTENHKSKLIFDMTILDIISSHPGVASLITFDSSVSGHQYQFSCSVQTIFNETLEISNFYMV